VRASIRPRARVSFAALRELVGFPAYDEAAKRYEAD
jgi:hypothetical protein